MEKVPSEDLAAAYADVFGVLADETRLRTILSLARRHRQEGPLSYSAAMEAASVDDSGRFNYHLEKLREYFVRLEDGAYEPTAAWLDVWHLMRTGRPTGTADADGAALGATSECCGAPLEARFDWDFHVRCGACGDERMKAAASPDLVAERDVRTLAHEFDAALRDRTRLLFDGNCPDCGTRTEVRFADAADRYYAWDLLDVTLWLGCPRCARSVPYQTVGQFLLGHPRMRDYCERHGIDLDARPRWEYQWANTDRSTVIRSRDPWEIEKYAYLDGCRLVAVVEADGSVAHVDHVRVDGRWE